MLSIERGKSVRRWVENYSNSINWNIQVGRGSADTVTDPDNNDGCWRAVDIYVYGYRPPTVTIPEGSTQFEIRFLRSGSGAILLPGPEPLDFPLQGSAYYFQIVDKQKRETATFRYTDSNLSLFSLNLPALKGKDSRTTQALLHSR